MSETFEIEYTDTFGGEANYCWVKRAKITLREGVSDRELMRRAKAEMELTGIRGRTDNMGDCLRFRPYRSCTVMFVQFVY
jgi:hypothetical protein